MRVLCLTTYTADTEKNWRSLMALGHECVVRSYDDRPHDRHGELVAEAAAVCPDFIVYVGAIERYHGRPVPSSDVLCRLREVAPTIHICGDASDRPWWDLLTEYHDRGCFAAQVSIDGSFDTPIADFTEGVVKLTPTDPSLFEPLPAWVARGVRAGFTGGRGHGERAVLIDALLHAHAVTWLDGSSPYPTMCRFMTGCRVIVNNPMNGTGDSVHVKGRVIETGLAGACLLERENPVIRRWFDPGEYLAYGDADDALAVLALARENDAETEEIAGRFRVRVLAEHHPRVFWHDVFAVARIIDAAGA